MQTASHHAAGMMIALSLIAGPWLAAPAAHAQAGCPTRHLFVHDTGGNEAISWGQATTNQIRDVVLDANCAFSNRHGTAHIRDFLNPGAGVAEVGWMRGDVFGDGVERTRFFTNVRRADGVVIGPHYFDFGNLLGVWYRFRVSVNDFTNVWRFFVDDDLNGGRYTELCPLFPDCGVDAQFPNGYPMGETARVGALSAYDHHVNAWSRNNLGQWRAWTDQAIEIDDIVGYHWHQNSGKEYEVHVPEAQHGN